MKKILFANTSFLPTIGGVENSIRSLIEVFSADGWDCHLVTKEPTEVYTGDVKGITYYKNNNIFSGSSSFQVLARALKGNSFDLIVVRHHFLALIISFFRKDYVYVLAAVYEHQNKGGGKNAISKIKYILHVLIQRYVVNNGRKNIVFSCEMLEQVKQFYNGKFIEVINPGADAGRFYRRPEDIRNRIRKENGFSSNDVIMLCLGRLVDVKNFDLVVRAMPYLPSNYKLLFVGDGSELDNLRIQVSKLNIANRVIFSGKSSEPEIHYGSADVFCFSSVYEPFGQVLLEATFSELPVVALEPSRNEIKTATKEIYKGYEGLVYLSDNDPESFAEQVVHAYHGGINKYHHGRFILNFSWGKLKERLINIGLVN